MKNGWCSKNWHDDCDVLGMLDANALPRCLKTGLPAALLSALAVFAPFNSDASNPLETHEICAQAIDQAEEGARLPGELLTAISHVESGRWNPQKKALFAWPWTVTNGPDGQYFPTKDAAIAHVKKLQARGIRNIDVGCMQINLRYHPNAFENLESALDPETNARYAVTLLKRLHNAHKSWGEAIRRYHSATEKFNRPYHDKVVRQWNAARSNAAELHRQRVIATHRAQRAKWRAERAAQLADARSAIQQR